MFGRFRRRLIRFVPEEIELYAQAHTEPVDSLFDELREETLRSVKHPQMQVGRIEGTFLKLLVTAVRSPPGSRDRHVHGLLGPDDRVRAARGR